MLMHGTSLSRHGRIAVVIRAHKSTDSPMQYTANVLFTLLTYAPFIADIVECESTECKQM